MQHHGEALRKLKKEPILRALLEENQASLNVKDRAILAYCKKLTLTPASMDASDVAALRDQGFDDRGILDICQLAAYYNFVNRMADGLGVQLEPGYGENNPAANHSQS